MTDLITLRCIVYIYIYIDGCRAAFIKKILKFVIYFIHVPEYNQIIIYASGGLAQHCDICIIASVGIWLLRVHKTIDILSGEQRAIRHYGANSDYYEDLSHNCQFA